MTSDHDIKHPPLAHMWPDTVPQEEMKIVPSPAEQGALEIHSGVRINPVEPLQHIAIVRLCLPSGTEIQLEFTEHNFTMLVEKLQVDLAVLKKCNRDAAKPLPEGQHYE